MTKTRFTINSETHSVTDNDTGESVHPSCFHDLAPYYSYLCGTGRLKQGQQLLTDVFNGEKVISNMITSMHELYDTGTISNLTNKEDHNE